MSRLFKELRLYEAQVLSETGRTEAMRAAGECPHKIRQQVRKVNRAPSTLARSVRWSLRLRAQENVQAESAMMVPDVRLRLEHALGELTAAVVRAGRRDALAGWSWAFPELASL